MTNAHESNGSFERANRTLRSYHNLLIVFNHRSPTTDIVSYAAFGKNINCGNRIASSFEVIYNRSPLISGEAEFPKQPPPSMCSYCTLVARQIIDTRLRSNLRDPIILNVEDEVYFWRYHDGWLGPATVGSIDKTIVSVLQNGNLKTYG